MTTLRRPVRRVTPAVGRSPVAGGGRAAREGVRGSNGQLENIKLGPLVGAAWRPRAGLEARRKCQLQSNGSKRSATAMA